MARSVGMSRIDGNVNMSSGCFFSTNNYKADEDDRQDPAGGAKHTIPPKHESTRHTTTTTPPVLRPSDSITSLPPHLIRQISLLVGSQLMLNIGVSQVVPVLPLFASEMGLGASGVGLLVALPSAASTISSIPLGRAVDTIGRVPLMRIGTLTTALGSIGTGLLMSKGLGMVALPRLLVGAGSSASMVGSAAYMADITDAVPRFRARIMGLQAMVLGSAWVVGPLVGGTLAENYGAQNSFFVCGVSIALCSLGYSFLPETLPKKKLMGDAAVRKDVTLKEHGRMWWRDAKPLLQSPDQQALIALTASNAITGGVFMSVVTLHANNVWDAGPSGLGTAFGALALISILATPIGSTLADSLPSTQSKKNYLVVPALLTSHLAFGTLALATGFETFMASLVCSHLMSSLAGPAVQSYTAEVTPIAVRGQAMSLARTAGGLCSVCSPIALGVWADLMSCESAIVVAAGLNTGCAIFFAVRAGQSSKPPSGGDK